LAFAIEIRLGHIHHSTPMTFSRMGARLKINP